MPIHLSPTFNVYLKINHSSQYHSVEFLLGLEEKTGEASFSQHLRAVLIYNEVWIQQDHSPQYINHHIVAVVARQKCLNNIFYSPGVTMYDGETSTLKL